MPVYEIPSGNKLISFTDETGVSFKKNFVAGTTVEHSVDVNFATDVAVNMSCTSSSWGTSPLSSISGGIATVIGDDGYGQGITMSQVCSGLLTTDTVTITIDVADIGAGTLEVYADDATLPVEAIITSNGITTWTTTLSGLGAFVIYNATNGTTVLVNSCSVQIVAADTQDEIATLVSILAGTVSPANPLPFNMTWATPIIAFDTVDMIYDGTGNLEDPNTPERLFFDTFGGVLGEAIISRPPDIGLNWVGSAGVVVGANDEAFFGADGRTISGDYGQPFTIIKTSIINTDVLGNANHTGVYTRMSALNTFTDYVDIQLAILANGDGQITVRSIVATVNTNVKSLTFNSPQPSLNGPNAVIVEEKPGVMEVTYAGTMMTVTDAEFTGAGGLLPVTQYFGLSAFTNGINTHAGAYSVFTPTPLEAQTVRLGNCLDIALRPSLGFMEFADVTAGFNGVLAKWDMTSADLSLGNEIGSPTYSAAGMLGTPTAGFQLTGISGQGALATQGTLQFMVSKEFWNEADVPAPSQNALYLRSTNDLIFNINTDGRIEMSCNGNMVSKDTGQRMFLFGNENGWELDTDGQIEFIITWDTSGVIVYVDRFKMVDADWNGGLMPTFDDLRINTVGSSGGTYTYKNLLLSDKKTVINESTPETAIIHHYGNSYSQQAQYPDVDSSGRQSMFYRGVSVQSGYLKTTIDGLNGTTFTSRPVWRDASYNVIVHRQLMKARYNTPEIQFWGEGGSGVEVAGGSGSTIGQRVAIALGFTVPNVALFSFGYNDATQNAGSGPSDLLAYRATIEAIFQSLINANSGIKIVACTQPYNTNAAFVPTLASVQNVNQAISDAASSFSEVATADTFTLFGGAANDGTGNMSEDFVHIDAVGHGIYGKEIARILLTLL